VVVVVIKEEEVLDVDDDAVQLVKVLFETV
jgi:hypothetical protein